MPTSQVIKVVDLDQNTLSIDSHHTVQSCRIDAGPPTTREGLNIGLVTLEQNPPHKGERHNDGDEILIVISGKIEIETDTTRGTPSLLCAGQSAIILKGEWHQVNVIEKAQLVYITPGENNEYRF